MKKFTILAVSLLLLSCTQDVKRNRNLEGEWRTVSLKVTEASGIGDFVTSSGNMTFSSEKGSKTGSYNFDLSYEYKSNNYAILETGTYTISGQEVVLTNAGGDKTISDLNYVNKEDLEFIIPNWNNKNIYFLMKKN